MFFATDKIELSTSDPAQRRSPGVAWGETSTLPEQFPDVVEPAVQSAAGSNAIPVERDAPWHVNLGLGKPADWPLRATRVQ